MPKKPVVIGELSFSSKGEAKEYFSRILNKYTLGEVLKGNEFDDVMALLLCHPMAEEKVGVGIKFIKVDRGFYSSNRCFHVIRDDGSIEDFSIGKCIDGDHTPFHKFCIACRRVVAADLRAMKAKYFEEYSDKEGKIICPITKEKITFDEAHIDHREPFTFSSIVHFFVKANNLDLNSIAYVIKEKYGNEFEDNELAKKFRDWHRDNATLRVVKGKANLSKSYLGRVTLTQADNKLK